MDGSVVIDGRFVEVHMISGEGKDQESSRRVVLVVSHSMIL